MKIHALARKALYVVLLSVISALCVIYRQEIADTAINHPLTLTYAVVLMLAGMYVQVTNFLEILNPDQPIPFSPTLTTWASASLVNFLGPFQPGLAVRFLFFQQRGVSLDSVAVATLAQTYLSLRMSTGVIAAGSLLVGSVAGLAFGTLFGVLFLFWPRLTHFLRHFVARLPLPASVHWGRDFVTGALQNRPLRKMHLFLLQYLVGAILLYGVYFSFGAALTVGQALLLASIVYVSAIVALLPNNLGLQDVLYGWVAYQEGLDVGEATALAIFFRVAQILTCLLIIGSTKIYGLVNLRINRSNGSP